MSTFAKYGLNNYSIMEVPGTLLSQFLEDATREELINWLCWNDKNGIYNDIDHLAEFDCIMTKEDAIINVKNQIELIK